MSSLVPGLIAICDYIDAFIEDTSLAGFEIHWLSPHTH